MDTALYDQAIHNLEQLEQTIQNSVSSKINAEMIYLDGYDTSAIQTKNKTDVDTGKQAAVDGLDKIKQAGENAKTAS